MTNIGLALAERGLVATPLLRHAIRRMCATRLHDARAAGPTDTFLERVAGSRIAEVPEVANAQHYELPSEFFALALGRHRKYSSAIWPEGTETLDEAEEAMLALTCERAQLADGQDILELGCGWGSLSLFMARRYPGARILAVSNSATQRAYLETVAPPNLEIRTADMNGFDPGRQFDRVVSVEMFEHMRDWRTLLGRVAGWMRDDARLFIHVFCHRELAYPFESTGDGNWMGRHFFSGGIMPSHDLLPRAADGLLATEERWWIDGTHYARTAAAWLANLEARRDDAMVILRAHYGDDADIWYHRWRMFFLACEELFGFDDGREWGVGHYRLARTAVTSAAA